MPSYHTPRWDCAGEAIPHLYLASWLRCPGLPGECLHGLLASPDGSHASRSRRFVGSGARVLYQSPTSQRSCSVQHREFLQRTRRGTHVEASPEQLPVKSGLPLTLPSWNLPLMHSSYEIVNESNTVVPLSFRCCHLSLCNFTVLK
ncbi:hypothetical protein RvY_10531-2 [Ramazzottius varieornatus]|uniref:Uncharacterized protein n=1 Tax=Ramazzottius varieornatus TaxID=947166 RepID=A0A1D1VKU1_RAMVA|nr:hypothetical protein RvY_10531-2 [Ramazzottius varieornatus]